MDNPASVNGSVDQIGQRPGCQKVISGGIVLSSDEFRIPVIVRMLIVSSKVAHVSRILESG